VSTSLAPLPIDYSVPPDQALAVIERCATDLEAAENVPDVLRQVARAAAIEAVVRKIHASKRVKKAALRLVVQAERQLGTITAQLPKGKRGRIVRGTDNPTKAELLAQAGLRQKRVSSAERMAAIPDAKVERAVQAQTSLSGVQRQLGVLNEAGPTFRSRQDAMRDMTYLAREAIELLDSCSSRKAPPSQGNVNEMKKRFDAISKRASASYQGAFS
jgi:hypothetical protein